MIMMVRCDQEFDGPIAGCGVGVGVLTGGSIDIPSSW